MTALLSVAEALERVLALLSPVGAEAVPLARAAGRVLAEDAVAAVMGGNARRVLAETLP